MAAVLAPDDFDLSPATVRAHASAIYLALGVVVYFLYGVRHSRLAVANRKPTS